MANGYETPAEDAADTAPEGPAEDAGEGQGKISKQQANYRESNKVQCCGLCANFTGSAGENPNQCTKVGVEGDGDISAFGLSDEYTKQDNPFREGESPDNPFAGGVPVPPMAAVGGMMPMLGGPNQPGGGTVTAAVSPPPQISNPRVGQTGVMSPRLRIGAKSYAG